MDELNTKGVTVAYGNPTPPNVEWRCAGHDDPGIFDPLDEVELAEAKSFCDGCDVRSLCLALGISRDEWGVWGGVLLESGKPIEKVKARGRPRKVVAA